MSNKIWVLNSLGKDVLYRDKEKVDNYIKLAIEAGYLVKLSYVNKEVQAFFRACAQGQLYTGEIQSEDIKDYIKDYQSSSKILFVDEKGYDERLLNFSNDTTDFVLKKEINEDKDDWLDYGSLSIPINKHAQPKKMVKEKTDYWGFLFALLPYMYFIINYSRKFTSVLTVTTLWAVILLVYKISKKKVNILNIGVAGIFVLLSVLRIFNPYWINSISAIFATLGICGIFLIGEFLEEGILSLYYKTSLRQDTEYTKFTVAWLISFAIILGNLIYFGGVSFVLSSGLMFLVWVITSVNLKSCEVEVKENEMM